MADKDTDKDKVVADMVDEDDLISSDSGYVHHRRRGWIMVIIYMLIALAFAIAVVYLGRWIYHKVHKPSTTTTSTSQSSSTSTPPPATSTNNSSNSSTPSTTNNSSNSSQSSTAQTNSSTPSTTAVPNTGPGNVLALFVGTAVIIGGLHFVWSVRRA